MSGELFLGSSACLLWGPYFDTLQVLSLIYAIAILGYKAAPSDERSSGSDAAVAA